MPSTPSHQTCPECSHHFPVIANELQWCDKCNWNIEGDAGKEKQGRLEKIQRLLGAKLAQQLFTELDSKRIERPRLSGAKLLVYGYATLVHLVTLSLPVLSIIMFLKFHFVIAAIVSLPLLMLLWTIFPRPRKFPKDIVDRNKFPMVYRICDEVADKMGTTRVTSIVLNSEFNAYYTEFNFGPWKKKVVTLGVPLMSQLTDEEIVAIISHETSHGANGDVARGFYVGLALSTLATWFYALKPRSIDEGGGTVLGGVLATWAGNLLGLMLSNIPYWGYHVLLRLLFRQTQEAEYLADRLAAKVCGTKAMISALEKLDHSHLSMAVQTAALNKSANIDVLALSKELASVPRSERERERRKRVEIKWGTSLDATHPPGSYRISFISKEPHLPQVRLTEIDSQKLREELSSLNEKVSKELIDGYLDRLYYGG